MSWDNNNVACILVFPPWQKKGLGAILIGCSYEISRRENLLGGPEKPISDLGKKGYGRFWGAEIARYILDLEEGDDTVTEVAQEEEEMIVVEEPEKPRKGLGKGWRKGMTGVGMQPQTLPRSTFTTTTPANPPSKSKAASETKATLSIDNNCAATTVEAISQGTWIATEDVLGVLRAMNVVEKIEKKPTLGKSSAAAASEKFNVEVKIDKAMVRNWALKERLNLDRCVREEGFVKGYGYPKSNASASVGSGRRDSRDSLSRRESVGSIVVRSDSFEMSARCGEEELEEEL